METKMELRYLSSIFYQKYKNCPEIMSKGETRPYIILLVETDGFKFAIPIRTHLHKTKDCYESNPKTNSGLDYTKSKEIKLAFAKFVADYKKDVIRHEKNPSIPANPRFQFCSLQYFKKELGLEFNSR